MRQKTAIAQATELPEMSSGRFALGSASRVLGRLLLVLLTVLLALALTLFLLLRMACHGPSPAAKELFATTILETGQLKFLASLVMSEDELKELMANNAMPLIDEVQDTELITVSAAEPEDETDPAEEFDIDAVEIYEVSGRTFFATMMVVNDPSRVKLATTYPWGAYGKELETLVDENDAVAGINGGLYQSDENTGGMPIGVAVRDGEIQYNRPNIPGLYIIGFDEDDILRVIDINGMDDGDVEELVAEERIRDAVVFQEYTNDVNNHFVQLVINGVPRESDGMGSGANPRTAIGQRADGAVLLLVTDGRGASGHLGATATDLVDIMLEYGAVNAANLDGGSSSCMYYEDGYLMHSTTLYYNNTSWRLPTAFIVESR